MLQQESQDDPVDDRVVGDEGYALHLDSADLSSKGIDLIDLPYKLPPAR
jgi:hypothetical protein